MKKLVFVILVSVMLVSCGSKHRQTPYLEEDSTSVFKEEVDSAAPEQSEQKEETAAPETVSGSKAESKSRGEKRQSAMSSISSHQSTTTDDEYDNMRGFDPPSEDDMDDNGLSRYMENNDEEGWY
ncbi:MAG: hypothetical protein K6C10_00420 [Prevotella sp.]|nr:hypothetical protein [Prevotella sp.]